MVESRISGIHGGLGIYSPPVRGYYWIRLCFPLKFKYSKEGKDNTSLNSKCYIPKYIAYQIFRVINSEPVCKFLAIIVFLFVWLLYNWKWKCYSLSHSLCSHGLQLVRLRCPWNSPGKNAEMDCHSLFQVIFPTQGLNLGLSHWRQILYCWATREAHMIESIKRMTSCHLRHHGWTLMILC